MVDSNQQPDQIKSGKDAVDKLLHERKVNRINTAFHNSVSTLFSWAVVLSVFLIVLIYFLLPTSKVKVLSVKGNNYLDKSYIERLSGINYNTRYFLVFPHATANRIKEDPQIKDATIRLLPEHVVQIDVVEEQPLGYRYEEKGPVILLGSGNKVELTSEKMTMISRIPLIDGFFEDEQTSKLIKALCVIKPSMLEEITEIRQYNLDYDEETMMIQMREGGYFFTNYYLIDSI
ncbi:MAG: FtsQ-type POTRA domain-containing protein, partial [Solobacterium sp.]|nr:FtsQ-type POTRA domain-containing protein [Solobacterium sp.]